MKNDFSYHLICPVCKRGEIISDGKGKITVSVQCPKCRNIFKADLDAMKTERSSPQRRNNRNKRAS